MRHLVFAITALGVLATVASTVFGQRPRRPEGPPGQGTRQRQAGRFDRLLRLLDTDGDGTLSQGEISGAAAKLAELDTSKDGALSADELRGPSASGPGRRTRSGPRGPQRGRGQDGAGQTSPVAPPLPRDDQEKRIVAALEQVRQGPRFANVSTADGRLLRLLTETIGAKRVVEIGTSTGESAIWFALALRSTGGHLFTHEIDAARAEIAAENFEKAGVDGLITIVLGDAHETVKRYKEPIDLLFLDADKQGYIDYLDKLVPLIRPGGLIIAHNMRYPRPDERYIDAITSNPNMETLFLLMDGAGVGVTLKKR